MIQHSRFSRMIVAIGAAGVTMGIVACGGPTTSITSVVSGPLVPPYRHLMVFMPLRDDSAQLFVERFLANYVGGGTITPSSDFFASNQSQGMAQMRREVEARGVEGFLSIALLSHDQESASGVKKARARCGEFETASGCRSVIGMTNAGYDTAVPWDAIWARIIDLGSGEQVWEAAVSLDKAETGHRGQMLESLRELGLQLRIDGRIP